MKNIFVLLFLLGAQWGLGQNCGIETPLGSTIDTYDWQQEQFEFWIVGCGERHPYSPFWSSGNYNPNTRHLYGPPDDDDGSWVRDYRPEDGWELLYKHFGTQAKPAEVPVLMLYNRYESNIRMFFYLTPKQEYSGATIKMFFEPNIESALLNYVAQPQKALDDFRKEMEVHMPNKYENGSGGDNCEGFWIFGDIPVAYDPCTCHNSLVLQISPFLVDSATISLDITGGGTITQIASQGSFNSTGHTSVLQNLNGAVAKGAKTAKTLQGFYNTAEAVASTFDLIGYGNDYNSYGDYEAIVADGVSSSSAKDAAQKAIDELDKRAKSSFSFPKWMKDIPKIGVAIGILDFIIGGGKSSGGSKPKPTSFEADLNFTATGKIIDPSPYTSTRLYVPGSDYPTTALEEETPVYDNTLGVFALLETPIVKRKTVLTECDFLGDPDYITRMQLQLASDLKYAINPASGLNAVDIGVRFVLEDTLELNLGAPDVSDMDHIIRENDWKSTYLSPILSLACSKDYVLTIHADCGEMNRMPKVFVEINVTLERNSADPFYGQNADKVFLRHRYLADVFEASVTDDSNLSTIRKNVTLGSLNLDEDVTIYAWSTINIAGTIVTNGHKLTVIAGNEITGNISDLPDGVDLIIGDPAGCGSEVPAQTPTEINTFCNSDKYNPVAGQPGNPQDGEVGQTKESKSYLSVSPNPFKDYFKITYHLEAEKEVFGFLRNSLGEVVREMKLEGGEKEKELIVTVGDLPTGIYFLTIQTESDLKTVKLIKHGE